MTSVQPGSNLAVQIPKLNSVNIAHGTARVGDHQPPHDGECIKQEPARPRSQTVSQAKFAKIIIDVDNRLSRTKLKDIAFLCYDKVSDKHVLEEAKSAKDIFKDMSDNGTLRKDNIGMIAELLVRVSMVKAMKEAFQGTGITYPDGRERYLDTFRCLLHDITQHLPKRKLKDVKEYCSLQEISEDAIQLEEASDFLVFFTLLEEQELIARDNIGLLIDFSVHVFKKQKVRDFIGEYEEQMRDGGKPILSLTETISDRIFRWEKWVTSDGNKKLSLTEFYGHEDYERMSRGTTRSKQNKKEEKGTDMDTTPQGDYPPSSLGGQVQPLASPARGLVTPSMLQGSASFGSMKADGNHNGSPEPPRNQQRPEEPAPLDSMEQDMEGESDDEEFLTISQDTYHRSIQIPYYKMDAEPRGICLIISNRSFSHDRAKDREGTEKDVENLTKTFRGFHFDVQLREDLTGEEMKAELRKWKNHEHKSYHAFVCCILSHGNRGLVLGNDGSPVDIVKIVGYFKGSSCPSLIGKPKVFIIQACQGDSWQRLTNDQTPHSPTRETAGMGSYFEPLPTEADILLLLSTVPGYKSVRTKSGGSWFIMALTKIWEKYPDAEVQSVVTLVNHELSRVKNAIDEGRVVTQTAFPSYTLRKMLFFKPPVRQPVMHGEMSSREQER